MIVHVSVFIVCLQQIHAEDRSGSASRVDPRHSQDVPQQKSETGDQQLAWGRGGEDLDFQLIFALEEIIWLTYQYQVKIWIKK